MPMMSLIDRWALHVNTNADALDSPASNRPADASIVKMMANSNIIILIYMFSIRNDASASFAVFVEQKALERVGEHVPSIKNFFFWKYWHD
jgi:hypothetical protein